MSTTTQILFNSPALHSLKRDQLVKLCKIHSIKASGKNTELIDKLKKHAETLPKDAPLSIAVRTGNASGEPLRHGGEADQMDADPRTLEEDASPDVRGVSQTSRPSDQWEVVMESIDEVAEDSPPGTINSLKSFEGNDDGSGEFGTAMSKSSSITSSLKSFASSFGFTRAGSSTTTLISSSSSKSGLPTRDDELSMRSVPYPLLTTTEPPPQTDHLTFHHQMQNVDELLEPQEPLPGHSLRPGVPAPANARLSLGLGLDPPSTPSRHQPTTTIRLISKPSNDAAYGRTPQLKPFTTSFDLVLGSPQGFGKSRGTTLWPNGSDEEETMGIYPSLGDPTSPTPGRSKASAMPGGISDSPRSPRPLPLPPPAASTTTTSGEDFPNPWPRPLPLPPMTASPTATSPSLHLRPLPPEPFVFGSPLPKHNVSNDQFKSAAASVLEEMNKRLDADGVDGVKMDLISRLQPGAHANGSIRSLRSKPEEKKCADVFYKDKFAALHQGEFNKMEGIDELVRRKSDMKKQSDASLGQQRKSSIAGHGAGRDRYGRRVSGHVGRVSMTRVISGKKPRIIPGGFDDDESDAEDEPVPSKDEVVEKQEDEKAKIRDEERKQKEKEAIRRKLEMNKQRRRSSAAAKGRVSVGRGGAIIKPEPQPKPSRFGFLSSAKSLVQNVWNRGKSKPTATQPPPAPSTSVTSKPASKPEKNAARAITTATFVKGSIAGPSRLSTTSGSSSKAQSLHVKVEGSLASSSTRSRSPLPSFAPSSKSSLVPKPGRPNSLAGASLKSTVSQGATSSIGVRTSLASASSKATSSGSAGSFGAKKLPTAARLSATTPAATSSASSSSLKPPSRLSSSRLFAPTASSLAKTARPSAPGSALKPAVRAPTADATKNVKPIGPWSPRTDKIFSKPLDMSMVPPSRIPSPVRPKVTDGIPQPSTSNDPVAETKDGVPVKQRSLNGRKPRISRSKVIAKLASQRAANGSGTPSARRISSKVGGTPGRKRSSLGVKAQRSSFAGGIIKAGAGEDAVLMSAKKRVRQSEYHARRRSRAQPIEKGGKDNDAMDIAQG